MDLEIHNTVLIIRSCRLWLSSSIPHENISPKASHGNTLQKGCDYTPNRSDRLGYCSLKAVCSFWIIFATALSTTLLYTFSFQHIAATMLWGSRFLRLTERWRYMSDPMHVTSWIIHELHQVKVYFSMFSFDSREHACNERVAPSSLGHVISLSDRFSSSFSTDCLRFLTFASFQLVPFARCRWGSFRLWHILLSSKLYGTRSPPSYLAVFWLC